MGAAAGILYLFRKTGTAGAEAKMMMRRKKKRSIAFLLVSAFASGRVFFRYFRGDRCNQGS